MHTQAQPAARDRGGIPGHHGRGAARPKPGGVPIEATRRGMVVLDHAVPDPEAFLAAVPTGFGVLRLGPSADPLDALLGVLDAAPPCASLHVVSHGRPGALLLGGAVLDAAALRRRRAEIEAVGRRLGPAAEVFLYGCEVAAGAQGRAFVRDLADLLGACVSASATPTGDAERGGDWRLDVLARRPMGRPIFGACEMAGYNGLLAAPPVTLAAGWVDVIKGAAFDPAGDPQAGTAGLDLRGDATQALLQAQSYNDGTTDYTGFRILYAGGIPAPYLFIGFDVDGDGTLDAFLGVEPSGNGAGAYVYDADPGKTNTSPSTTGIIGSNANPRIQITGATLGSVAANAGTSHYVSWMETNRLTAAINAKAHSSITASSSLSYLVFSATQDNSINGDLGGASVNSTATFASLGVFTRQSLVAPTATSAPVPAPVNLALTVDTGASASDRITSDGRVSGTAGAGATVNLYEGATHLGTAVADGSGNWTITPGGLLDGAHTVTATATDNGTTSASSTGFTYTLDTTAPAVTIAGASGPTHQGARTITGAAGVAEAGRTVTLRDGTGVIGTATVRGDGGWSVGVTLAGQGAHTLTAAVTDAAGNTGTSAAVTYTVVPDAPSSVSPTDDVGAVTGMLAGGARTDDTDLTVTVGLTGTGARAGDTVRLYDGTGTANPLGGLHILNGADIAAGYTTLRTGALTDGTTYAITARITDAAGNPGAASGPVSVSVDISPPPPPSITGFAPDTGLAGDAITAGDATGGIALSGTAEAGSTVAVFASKDGGAPVRIGTTVATGGAWSLPTRTLPDGAYDFTATATDAAGNTGPTSASFVVAVDRTAPAAPPIQAVTDDAGPIAAALSSGASTADADPAVRVGLTGTGARVGDTVQLYDGAGTAAPLGIAHTLTAADIADGHATVQTGALADGTTYAITARVTDAAGNESASSSQPFVVVEDRTPPAVVIAGTGGPTNRAAQTVTGTAGAAEAGRTVTLRDGTGVIGTATVRGDGGWSVGVTLAGQGAHTLTAAVTDAAGNTGTSTAVTYTLDTVAPGAPVITSPGGLTDRPAQTVSGTAEPGGTVAVYDGTVPLGTTTAGASGLWGLGIALAGQGAHGLTAAATDAAGNTGPASAPVGYTLDSDPPVPVAATFWGASLTLMLSDASPLDAANPPPAGAFSVTRTVGAATTTLRPTGVTVAAGGRTVTLTFATPLSGASSVLLDYTDPGQGAPGALWDTPHNRALSFSRLAVLPEDNDGVGPAMEANVPGRPDAQGAVTAGDGNADGVPDALQPDVTSFSFVPGGTAGAAVYATLVAGSGAAGAAVAQLGGVSQAVSVSGAPAGLVSPYGEFRFHATVGAPGGTQSFRLLLPDDPAVTGYWKTSRLDGRWYNIATSLDRSVPGTMDLAFSIEDGGAFDDDGAADGIVTDPGVPGYMVALGSPAAPSVRTLTTNSAAPVLSGSWGGTSGGTDALSVTVAGVTYTAASPALTISGTEWSLRLPALGDGAYDIVATATRAGGGSARTDAVGALSVDTLAPSVSAWLTRDSNAFRTVGILRTEALTGITDPGAALGFTEGGRSLGTARADAGGAWVFRPEELGAGSRGVVAEVTDAAGNAGRATMGFTPVIAPTGEGGVGTADWRAMDLAGLLNEGGSLHFMAGTERVILADGTLTVGDDTNEAFLTRLYYGLLGRAPEANGIAWWQHQAERGAGKTVIAEGFLRMDEYTARSGNPTDARLVQELYRGVLGREGAAEEVTLWAEQLDAGRTRGAVLADIADSAEAKQHWSDVVTQGVWVRDTDAAVVRAAYLAAFGREAELGGLRYWTAALERGATPGEVGGGLAETAEFRMLHAGRDDAAFVENLYENGLGRVGEAQGVAGWMDALRTGAMTRGDVLMGFAQSEEGQQHLYWAL